jgi:hypothetical protein
LQRALSGQVSGIAGELYRCAPDTIIITITSAFRTERCDLHLSDAP